jgi:CDP-glucose 4,6-dehydratase
VELRTGAVENLVNNERNAWRGRSVLVTGHTGFKGAWLTAWLHRLGATVRGYALQPPTNPSLFDVARIGSLLQSDTRADLADLAQLRAVIERAQPEVIFHLAAQSLVRESYRDPLGTFATNVLGTAHVLEAARASSAVRALLLITTDKVYDNREWSYPYRELDALGGRNPYSASKAAAELVAASYRASFYGQGGHAARVATARAGNVIGGGDWAQDRLVPDCLRAFAKAEAVLLRYPRAVRPWQHVLDPLAGYLQLAERLLGTNGAPFARAWNFGPDGSGDASVGEVAHALAQLWGEGARVTETPSVQHPHEDGLLRLDSSLARSQLGWSPRWSLRDSLARTVEWQRAWLDGADMRDVCLRQIGEYEAAH